MAILDLKIGDLVWTINMAEEKILTTIGSVIQRPVPRNHQMVYILLTDGRELLASPDHPDSTGNPLGKLRKVDILDNSHVSEIRLVECKDKFVYDILPAGETGCYWANGVLIGSTLSEAFIENEDRTKFSLKAQLQYYLRNFGLLL